MALGARLGVIAISVSSERNVIATFPIEAIRARRDAWKRRKGVLKADGRLSRPGLG
jgi:hypothetical protein